jgi:hypothetical protein
MPAATRYYGTAQRHSSGPAVGRYGLIATASKLTLRTHLQQHITDWPVFGAHMEHTVLQGMIARLHHAQTSINCTFPQGNRSAIRQPVHGPC